jgi:hypothetical protein
MLTDQAPRGRHARRLRRRPIAALCVLALGVIASCEQSPTAPQLFPDITPRRSISGGGSFTLGVRSTTTVDYGSEGWKSTGIQFESGYRFVIRVTGSVTASPNTELGCYNSIDWSTVPDLDAYGPGEPAPRDQATGYLGVTLAFDSTAEPDRYITLRKTADGSAWQSDTLGGTSLTLFARRNNGPPAATNPERPSRGRALRAVGKLHYHGNRVLPSDK